MVTAPAAPTARTGVAACQRALAHARAARQRTVRELMEFVRFPTVGAQPRHAADMRRCAEWIDAHLSGFGMSTRIVPTRGHPLVRAEWNGAPGRPRVLVYGHYDVQPADPVQEWASPPFEPVVRGADLYGRGACDDKGQMWVHVKALEAYLAGAEAMPVNVVCLFEGEEEMGSSSLLCYLRERRKELRCDVAVISDMRMRSAGVPAITLGLRGAMSFELEVRGPDTDLHSGLFGGGVHNPVQALCELLSRLHTEDGRVAIPGFYDRVAAPAAEERAYLKRTGPSDAEILRDAGARLAWGEPGYSLYERTSIRPALTLNGISGGYCGPGVKSIIPSRVNAKLSFRLVSGQEPAEIERLFRRYIAHLTPPTVRTTLRRGFAARPALMNRKHPAVRAAAASLRESFGHAPVFVRSGGTIPVVSEIVEALGIPALLIGLARPDDRIHAPNEKFHLPNLFRGTEASIRLLARLGRSPRER